MTNSSTIDDKLSALVDMISSMASLNFSKRLDVEINEEPINVVAYGLNMLSEELEVNMVRRSLLEEVNSNLEQFAFTVAHDLKSPLNANLGLISLLEDQLRDNKDETVKECLAMLRKNNEQTAKLVSGILEYSRSNYQNMELEEIDLHKIMNELVAVHQVTKDVKLVCSSTLPLLIYNKTALRQILSNIVENAVKYNDKAECLLELSCKDNESFYEIAVKDNGPGMEHEQLRKAFDLFENFAADRSDSYGIGLSIVKKLISQANGTVRVDSQPGQGFTFTFTIEKRHVVDMMPPVVFN